MFSLDQGKSSKPDNIKGVCADAASGRLYFTTRSKLYAVDLVSEKTLWQKEPPGGTDRIAARRPAQTKTAERPREHRPGFSGWPR